MGHILIAVTDTTVTVDDVDVVLTADVTTADSESRIAQEHPELWRPFVTDQSPAPAADEPPAGVTGDTAAADDVDTTSAPAAPAARDVRAWARAEGIDVPASGPLPVAVVDQYMAREA